MRILMLDYDGVLHKDHVYYARGRIELRADGQLFEWAPELIKALAPFPAIKIVLSTSWVRHLGYTRARNHLPESLRERVIGATWHSGMGRHPDSPRPVYPTWWDQVYRYEQIQRYVRRARTTDWIAIDDDDLGWPESDRDKLVCTDPERGLSDRAAVERLEALLWQNNCEAAE